MYINYTSIKKIFFNVKVMKDKEKLRNCFRLKVIKEVCPLEVLYNPGLDPTSEKKNTMKETLLWMLNKDGNIRS